MIAGPGQTAIDNMNENAPRPIWPQLQAAAASPLRWPLTFSQPKVRLMTLLALLLIGSYLRMSHLGQYPLGVQQDELSDIYDGCSILETGADRFGARFPLVVRAFGENDYRPALYPWLTVPTQAVTGFSVAAGRFPSALMGAISLALIFLFAQRMAGTAYGLAALLFATLSPIHLQYSRLAHEGAILPAFLVIVILVLWQQASINGFRTRTLAALGLVTGFSTNAYQATKLTAFLLAAVIAIDILRYARPWLSRLAIFSTAALVGALPQVFVLLNQTDRFFARAKVLSVTADNPAAYVLEVLKNYWIHLAPRYLFWPGDIYDLSVARLLPAAVIFFYVGAVALPFLRRSGATRSWYFVYAASIISLLPAVITEGSPNALRASGFVGLTPFFSAAGMIIVGSWFRSEWFRRRIYYPAAVGAVVASAAVLIHWYVNSPVFREAYFQQVLVELGKKLGTYQKDYDQVIIEEYGSEPYIYVVSFSGMTPREFQASPKTIKSVGMDIVTRVGKYRFVPPGQLEAAVASARGTRLLVVSKRVFPGLTAIDSVSYGENKLYLGRPG